jgi:hypothetical protein
VHFAGASDIITDGYPKKATHPDNGGNPCDAMAINAAFAMLKPLTK